MSSLVGYGEKYVTVWNWYWQKSESEWVMYDTTVGTFLISYIRSVFRILSDIYEGAF